MTTAPALDAVQRDALWFEPTSAGLAPLVEAIGDVRLVLIGLIGEATHGTHDEFYRAAVPRRRHQPVPAAPAGGAAREALRPARLERAIGVIYRPESERASQYFRARLLEHFDAVLHIDETSALEPLERWAHSEGDLPETYPSGM